MKIPKISIEMVDSLYDALAHGDDAHKDWLHKALCAWATNAAFPPYLPQAIPMIMHCPECSQRHVDKGIFATKLHHTHSCQYCGFTWRPAVVNTVGVQFLPGFKDEQT